MSLLNYHKQIVYHHLFTIKAENEFIISDRPRKVVWLPYLPSAWQILQSCDHVNLFLEKKKLYEFLLSHFNKINHQTLSVLIFFCINQLVCLFLGLSELLVAA